jgi:hypothetical protein
LVIKRPRLHSHFTILVAADDVVLVTTLPAKSHRVKETIAASRYEPLALQPDVATRKGLEGRVDGISATQELMQPKGEGRPVCFRLVRFVAGE